MADTTNQEPSESSGLAGLGGAAALLGLGAAGSAAFGGGSKAFKPKAGKQTESMAPGRQAILAFLLDVLLQRLNQTGGVNQSFKSYLQNGPQRMAPLDPSAMASLREAIRQPGAFDQQTTVKPPRPSMFQDVAGGIGAAAMLAKVLGGEGGTSVLGAAKSGGSLLGDLLGLGGGAGGYGSGPYVTPTSAQSVADMIRSDPNGWSFSMPQSQGASGGSSLLGSFLGSWL